MNLVIDRGNSTTRCAVFDGRELADIYSTRHEEGMARPDQEIIQRIQEKVVAGRIERAIISNVREDAFGFPPVSEHVEKVIYLSDQTPLHFTVSYATRETLGTDRIANAAACEAEFPGLNCLVVDCGSCITYTVIANHALVGGAISPGIDMRFKSMNVFTGKLPLVCRTKRGEEPKLVGDSTEASIRSGVQLGVACEVNGMIEQFRSQFSDLIVIITGGDLLMIEPHLKGRIFARPFFTLFGLNEILERQ